MKVTPTAGQQPICAKKRALPGVFLKNNMRKLAKNLKMYESSLYTRESWMLVINYLIASPAEMRLRSQK